jgi:hypothetical protein
VTVISECLAVGPPRVQVREKDLSGKDLAVLCRQLRNLTRDTGAMLIVNDRVDVALAVNADAVQRTGTSLDVKDMPTSRGETCASAPPCTRSRMRWRRNRKGPTGSCSGLSTTRRASARTANRRASSGWARSRAS